jgi:hypothetical protein
MFAWLDQAAADQADSKRRDPWKLGSLVRLDAAAQLGVHQRIDAPPLFTLEGATAAGGGLEVRAFFAHRVAFSLGWERFGIGHESTGLTETGSARIARAADALWLGIRLDPLASERLAMFVGLSGGALFQRVSAAGSVWKLGNPGDAQPFECGGGGKIAPGFRLDLGGEAKLGSGVSVFASLGLATIAFGDAPIASCAGGAGSTQMFASRAGLAYSFDLGGSGGK